MDTFLRSANIPHIWSFTVLALAALIWKKKYGLLEVRLNELEMQEENPDVIIS